MLMEWSTACGVDDPVLVVPWTAGEDGPHWVDLRNDPDLLDKIHEADHHPAMLSALRQLNGSRSPAFTAKCDVWTMEAEELTSTREDLLLEPDIAVAGMACYIDLIWRDRAVFASRHRTEQLLYRLDRLAGELTHGLAKIEAVLRPAVLDLDTVVEGYSITLYVKGVGVDESEAEQRWSEALLDAAGIFRSRELLTT